MNAKTVVLYGLAIVGAYMGGMWLYNRYMSPTTKAATQAKAG